MDVVNTREALADLVRGWKQSGQSVAFVPTMGALHAGHLSLVELAQKRGDRVVVSVFVNPTQFAPHEDFDTYPRQEDADARLLREVGVDALYLPERGEMYPDGEDCAIKAGKAAEGLESDFRPHFFDGVVNVVSRLFDHVRPDMAIFGEKDFQQLQVISEMVAAHNMPIKIIGAPIARDEYGLALSSRNAYLDADELEIARKLNVILREESNAEAAAQALLEAGFDKIDYISERWGRRLGAAWLGRTRLIDNVPIE